MGCAISGDNRAAPLSACDDPLSRQRFVANCKPDVRLTEKVQLNFDLVLANANGLDALEAFAKAEMSDENICCWKAIQRFKQVACSSSPPQCDGRSTHSFDSRSGIDGSKSEATMREIADYVITTFLVPDCKMPITVSSSISNAFQLEPSEGAYDYSLGIFDEVQAGVCCVPRL